MTLRKWKITKQSKQQLNLSSRHCKMLQWHPIHRVRIPYSKFSSPKTCRNVHENNLKIGHTRLTRFFSFSNAPMTPEGYWYACVRGRLEIVWRHKHANEENTRSLFSCFLQWNFLKVCMLHALDPTVQNNFLTKFFERISFLKWRVIIAVNFFWSKIWHCTILKIPLDKFFIFSN